MKNKVIIIFLSVLAFLLVGSSLYINLIARKDTGMSYIILIDLLIGIGASIYFIVLGNKYLENKKDYQIMFISLLILVFTLAISIFNVSVGYSNVLNINNYKSYMAYSSANMSLWIYVLYIVIIGIINLNMFIKYKISEKD